MNAETKHSGPVDVLAVLRAAAHTFKSRGELMPHDDLMQAEIAVVELIEAAPALSDYLDGYLAWQREQGNDPIGLIIAEADIARFRAAIANVGSAS